MGKQGTKSPFIPTFRFKSFVDINCEFLYKNNIKGLILDVDNTLTTHCNPVPAEGVLDKISDFRKNNIKLIILSNNTSERILPFAKMLETDFIANGAKPLSSGFKRCINKLNLSKDEVCVVGDQLFTDILGGNLFNIKTILTEPIEAESGSFFKFKRHLEKRILK